MAINRNNLLCKKGVRSCAITICMLSLCIVSQAQFDTRKSAEDFLKKIVESYAKLDTLSYDLQYTYSNESTPEKILDSLSGHVDRLNTDFHLSLGPTEVITIDTLSINLFKEDKILYLTKRDTKDIASQLMLPDSFFSKLGNATYQVSKKAQDAQLTINFPNGSTYKSISIDVDDATDFITEVRYIVKTDQLMLPGATSEENSQSSAYEQYASVIVRFTDYSKQKKFPNDLFNISNYLVKKENGFETSVAYKDYKIIVATLNL